MKPDYRYNSRWFDRLQLFVAIVVACCAHSTFAQQPAYGQFLSDNANSPMPPAAGAPQFSSSQSLAPLPLLNQYPQMPAGQLAALPPGPMATSPIFASPIASDPPDALAADPSRVPARLASYPRDVTEPLLDQPNNFVLLPEASQAKAPPQRDGFFQRISLTATYLPRFDENNNVGFADTEVYGVFGLPCPTRDCPLLIEPGTDFWVLDAPHGFDLPATLHDDYLEFHWLAKLSETWGADLMVTPGWHSDYHNPNGAQAFRLESHAVVVYTWSPQLKIAVGAAYWGRLNANVVPAGGVIWTPNDDTRFELITPKPRIAYRIDCDPCYERWAYIAGEFGGGQWAIQQAGGVENILNYSDYRVMVGIEHKSLDLSLNGFAEVGYVFGRQLEYQHFLPDQNLPSTMMVRIGVSY